MSDFYILKNQKLQLRRSQSLENDETSLVGRTALFFLEFSHGIEKLQMILLWGNTASAGASRILANTNLFCLSLVLTLVFTYINTFLSILMIVLTIFAS